jgi:IS30 family transposase
VLPCDPIGICRRTKETRSAFCGPRGGRWGRLPGRSVGRKPPSPGSCSGTLSPRADTRRFTPPEPINCAGGLRAIGCETIYAFIYRTAQKAAAWWRYLTRRHKRRRPRRARASRDSIKDRASIHDRPKTIEGRGEAGHWEGDLIICKRTRPVLVLHERKSRVTLAARLTGKTAAETISAMLAVFGRIDPHLRRSITFDNDTAFAQHGLLRTMRDMTTWFCDAYASWQKGGVENANGRLRRWLPRHLDIDRTSDQDIQEIVLTTNLTPRKCLGFKTPFQALLAELGKDVQIRFS